MKKLYTVKVSFDFVMAAESLELAEATAHRHIRDALNDMGEMDVETRVSVGATADGWDDDCIPYGGDGKTPIKDYKINNVTEALQAALDQTNMMLMEKQSYPTGWDVYNSGAQIASGLTYQEAIEYITPERLERGWCVVCVVDKSNPPNLEKSSHGYQSESRLEVLEREHQEFFERWHDERRKREALELKLNQWVGLTDKDKDHLMNMYERSSFGLIREVETLLRKKNS
jgi:hypothetical protein